MSSKNDYLAKYLGSSPAQSNSDYVEKKSKKKKKKAGAKGHTKGVAVRVIDDDEDSQPRTKHSAEKLQVAFACSFDVNYHMDVRCTLW